MNFAIRVVACFFFVLLSCNSYAQRGAVAVRCFYPKDSAKFRMQHRSLEFGYQRAKYGRTTMILFCSNGADRYFMVFKKNVHQLSRMVDYEGGSVGEVFDFKAKCWRHEEGTWSHSEMKGPAKDTVVYSLHDLYCFILRDTSSGVVECARFKDFGNEVYWPEFDYPRCSISDEDGDGKPEFYLSYMGYSDGLDAKPFKQIVYTIGDSPNEAVKAKITAFYPAGNEEDVYRVEFDPSWGKLAIPIKNKSMRLLKEHRVGDR